LKFLKGTKLSNTLPLSQLFGFWKGNLIASAFQALQRGLDKERQRLGACQYIVIELTREFDYDGLWERIKLLQGFDAPTLARQFVDNSFAAALDKALAEPRKNSPWMLEQSKNDQVFAQRNSVAGVHCDYLRSFKVGCDSAYEMRFVQFEVIALPIASGLSEQFFGYLGHEHEIVRYLMNIGGE
jgi:hypothetical protein